MALPKEATVVDIAGNITDKPTFMVVMADGFC